MQYLAARPPKEETERHGHRSSLDRSPVPDFFRRRRPISNFVKGRNPVSCSLAVAVPYIFSQRAASRWHSKLV